MESVTLIPTLASTSWSTGCRYLSLIKAQSVMVFRGQVERLMLKNQTPLSTSSHDGIKRPGATFLPFTTT